MNYALITAALAVASSYFVFGPDHWPSFVVATARVVFFITAVCTLMIVLARLFRCEPRGRSNVEE